MGYWSWQHQTIPAEIKAEALQEIERKLSRLPLDELPRRELVQIAEGVRDRLFRPVLEGQEAAGRRARAEEEARQRARAEEDAQRRAKVQQDAAHWSAESTARERAEAKRRLLERGMSVVDLELRADRDLGPRERADILAWAEGVLAQELSGTESTEEVEEIVNNILDEEFGEDDDPDGEDAEDLDEDDEDADDDSEFE